MLSVSKPAGLVTDIHYFSEMFRHPGYWPISQFQVKMKVRRPEKARGSAFGNLKDIGSQPPARCFIGYDGRTCLSGLYQFFSDGFAIL